jgi:hypothetical protein
MIFNKMKMEMDGYVAPTAGAVCLRLEGVIADSLCPAIKNGKVWYNEYTTENMETPVGQDVIIL